MRRVCDILAVDLCREQRGGPVVSDVQGGDTPTLAAYSATNSRRFCSSLKCCTSAAVALPSAAGAVTLGTSAKAAKHSDWKSIAFVMTCAMSSVGGCEAELHHCRVERHRRVLGFGVRSHAVTEHGRRLLTQLVDDFCAWVCVGGSGGGRRRRLRAEPFATNAIQPGLRHLQKFYFGPAKQFCGSNRRDEIS